jgi:hypothetical protein
VVKVDGDTEAETLTRRPTRPDQNLGLEELRREVAKAVRSVMHDAG